MKQIYDCVCLGAMLVLIKPCDPTKARRGRGYRNALALTLEDGTLSTLLSLLLLHISTFFASAASFLCCLHTCQAFIKQLEEGVSLPTLSHQSSPLEEPEDTPLSRPGAEPGAWAGTGVQTMCSRLGLPLEKLCGSPVYRPGFSLNLNWQLLKAAPTGTIWDRFTCEACFISSLCNKHRKWEKAQSGKDQAEGENSAVWLAGTVGWIAEEYCGTGKQSKQRWQGRLSFHNVCLHRIRVICFLSWLTEAESWYLIGCCPHGITA